MRKRKQNKRRVDGIRNEERMGEGELRRGFLSQDLKEMRELISKELGKEYCR